MLSSYEARGTLTTLPELKKVKLERPAGASEDWQGISHIELLEGLRNTFREQGLRPGEPVIHVSRLGFDMAASFPVAGPGLESVRWVPHVGLTSSNARRKALTFYAGFKIDDAGIVTSSDKIGRYTAGHDLEDTFWKAFDAWNKHAEGMDAFVEDMSDRIVNGSDAWRVMGQAGRKELMSPSRILKTQETFLAAGELSALSLLVAFGDACRIAPADHVMDQMLAFSDLVQSLIVPAEPKRKKKVTA